MQVVLRDLTLQKRFGMFTPTDCAKDKKMWRFIAVHDVKAFLLDWAMKGSSSQISQPLREVFDA